MPLNGERGCLAARSAPSFIAFPRMARVVVAEFPRIAVLYEDGSVHRLPSTIPFIPATQEFINGVATKDVVINSSTGTWARIFLPHSVANRGPDQSAAPLVLHFHGGGMCVGDPAQLSFHNFCSRMAAKSSSIWISLAYRLAPEHRLPAQYQDCYEAICWLRAQFATEKQPWQHGDGPGTSEKEPWKLEQGELSTVSCTSEKERWLIEHGDASRVFCTGESAGAIILHFVALQLAKREWSPLHIRGLMFVDTGVIAEPLPEMKPSTHPFLTTQMLAAVARFSLPEGAKLGDPLLHCLHPDSPRLSEVPLPPALVLVAERDLFFEGGMDYFKALKQAGKDVELHVTYGEGHCFHFFKPESELSQVLEGRMVKFMEKH